MPEAKDAAYDLVLMFAVSCFCQSALRYESHKLDSAVAVKLKTKSVKRKIVFQVAS